MAVTNLSTALTDFNPGYNPIVYIFDSTNKNEEGFRYVVDIYAAGTANKIYEGRVAPRPTDGYGYIDVSKIISNYLTYNLAFGSSLLQNASNSYYAYDIKIGEEYIVEWEFDDSIFASGNITQLTQSPGVTAHTFVVGDQIIVSQVTPSNFPQLEGLHSVNTVIDNYNFTIDIPFVSSPTNPGTVKYADNRKTITRDLLTYSTQVAFNGALSFGSWPSYDSALYKINDVDINNKMLTNIPDNFYCKTTQDLWIDYSTFASNVPRSAWFQNDTGDILRKNITAASWYVSQFSAGPNNLGTLTVQSGTAPLIKPTTKYYDIWLVDNANAQVTEKYRIYIDRRCPIETYEILFQDRLGSFSSFAFDLRSRETGSITRNSFNRQVGDFVTNKWTYNLYDAGLVNNHISTTKEFELTTNWMTQEMNVYFEELLTSPVTFLKIGTDYYSCIILDTNYEVQSSKYKKLIKKTIRVKLSSENIINI